MNIDHDIVVTEKKQENDNFIIELNVDKKHSYFLHISQAEQGVLIKQKKSIDEFAVEEMFNWINREGDLPHFSHLIYTSGGKIPTNDPTAHLMIKKTSDLVRTNVTIAASLFEWAKAKALKDETSFSDLVSRGLNLIKASSQVESSWYKDQGNQFRSKLSQKGSFGSFEVYHRLNNGKKLELQQLKDALKKSELHNTGWPIGVYLEGGNQRPSAQIDGIKAEYDDTPNLISDYWYAKQNGEFYFSRILESDSGHGNAEPGKVLFFDTLIWRVAESLEHCIRYYKELGIDSNELITVNIGLHQLNNRSLSAWNPGRAFSLSRHIAASDVALWETESKLIDLENNLDDVIYEAVKKLLIMFDFFVPNKEVVMDILNREYRKSNF